MYRIKQKQESYIMPRPSDFLPVKGKIPLTLTFDYVRDLTGEDILHYATAPAPKARGAIFTLRAVHRKIAQLVASGNYTTSEIAEATGRSTGRINDLCNDPTFKDLVEKFRGQFEEITFDVEVNIRQEALDVAQLAWREIRERLESDVDRKRIPVGELRQLATAAGDRTVLPPRTATAAVAPPVEITFNIPGPGITHRGEAAKDITPPALPARLEKD
jgi:hypothetical protein